jgi:hypothetical protein
MADSWRIASSSSLSVAAAKFSRRCDRDDVPGMSKVFGAAGKIQASATCAGCAPTRAATRATCGAPTIEPSPPLEPKWRERDERDPPPGAFVQDRLRSAIAQVVGILDARNLGELHGAKQV